MNIQFNLTGCAPRYRAGLRELLEERGCGIGETGLKILWTPGEAGKLSGRLEGGAVTVACPEEGPFYRGVMKLLRRLEEKGNGDWAFAEKIWFSSLGTMLDCSRNGVLRPEKVKEIIRRTAALGYNRLMLYTEDTYEVEGYPYFGAFRGRYTKDELRGLDDYGEKLGVELVPCIQTLAHLHTALRWQEMRGLRDTEDILLVGDEEVYGLIEAMIRTMAEVFGERDIHLGMDEAHSLGLGRYLDRHGYSDRFSIMNRHLERVLKICERYGMKPMIWSDMYFRLLSSKGGYYDLPEDAVFSAGQRPPRGVGMVYWDYYNEEKSHYDRYFRLHGQLGDRTVYAGGGWIWNGISPNYSKMSATLRAGMAGCRDNGVREALCTLWQDNGAETPMEAGNPALVVFAEEAYGELKPMETQRRDLSSETDGWLRFLWKDGAEAWELLDCFDSMPGALANNRNADNPSKYLLYQDVLLGLFDRQIEGLSLGRRYGELADRLEAYLAGHEDASGLFRYYCVLAKLLAVKAELGIQIYQAYHAGDRAFLRRAAEELIPRCAGLVGELSSLRRNIWFSECRPFGWEVLDIRFGGLKARLESASARLKQYLDGEAGRLEELEEERLLYAEDTEDGKHCLCACNLWQDIVSAGNIAGI